MNYLYFNINYLINSYKQITNFFACILICLLLRTILVSAKLNIKKAFFYCFGPAIITGTSEEIGLE